MPSIFTKIIKGEIPCHKLAEDESHLSFLDINPLVEGHALVIPKREIDYIFDLSDKELAALHIFSKKVGLAIEKVIPCQRIAISVIGIEVPHTHIHLIPLNQIEDTNFTKPKMRFSKEHLSDLASKISKEIVLD